MVNSSISRVVIVGGGTAGWLTASLLAAETRNSRPLEICLVESPDVPTIGVGEGTWPSMRMTLQKIGIAEAALLRRCDAAFKQGTQFVGWSEDRPSDSYYHPFSLPAEYSSLNLAESWLGLDSPGPFASFVTPQAAVIGAGLAPKQASMPEYAFALNYGYHFDAGRFAKLLHQHATANLGVRFRSANVIGIDSMENGDIAAVRLDNGERLGADLFVDCTGQRALLLGEHFGIGIQSVKNRLCNDTALAVQVPYHDEETALPSVTRATAMDSGWIWDIGLQTRRGTGYVYSSAHSSEQAAMATFRDYLARTSPAFHPEDLVFRKIDFEPGYRENFWVRNCVAIGLSGGFIEPLEASALALIEQGAGMLSRQFPANRGIMDVIARRFNEKMHYHWQRVVEFLKLHYVLSKRRDSDYWQDCRDTATIPESLCDKLELWQQQAPWHDDAPRVDELFPSASYQYVLYGMGFKPEVSRGRRPEGAMRETVDRILNENKQKSRQFLELLPGNRKLLEALTAVPGVA